MSRKNSNKSKLRTPDDIFEDDLELKPKKDKPHGLCAVGSLSTGEVQVADHTPTTTKSEVGVIVKYPR